jgi:hypothetical protein
MVGPPFLFGLHDALAAAPSWRHAESALFALRAAGGPVRRHALRGAAADAAVAAAVQEALVSMFSELCAPGGRVAATALAASPYARATAAELVGGYAEWFGAADGAPLDGALVLLLQGLQHAPSRAPAAVAFRALCSRCAARLAGTPAAVGALAGLSDLAAAAIAPSPPEGQAAGPCGLPFEDRAAVVEGLAQVAAVLPPAESPAAAARLAAPHLSRAQSVLAHGGDTAARGGAAAAQQLLDTLSEEIRLIAAVVRRLDVNTPGRLPGLPGRLPGLPGGGGGGMGAAVAAAPGAPQHPSLCVLESCWPLLGAVAESPLCRQESAVVEAVCEVFNVSSFIHPEMATNIYTNSSNTRTLNPEPHFSNPPTKQT